MEVESIFYKELDGPIMYMDDSHAPSLGTKFLQLKKEEKEQQLNKMLQDQEEEKEEKKQTSSPWEKLLDNVFGKVNEKTESKNSVDWSKATNLYDKKSDFRNDYGWSKALDGVQYSPLTKPDTGLFYVYLKAVCLQYLKFGFCHCVFKIYTRILSFKTANLFLILSKGQKNNRESKLALVDILSKNFKFWFSLAFEYP